MEKVSTAPIFKSYRLRSVQASIKERVLLEDSNLTFSGPNLEGLKLVAGGDLSFVPETNLAYVAIVVTEFPDVTKVVHVEYEVVEVDVPYIPGYLGFREAPFLKGVAGRLWERRPDLRPQVLLVDGHGQLHPRGAGVASHLGVELDIPTIGCGKSFMRMDGLTSKIVEEAVSDKLFKARGLSKASKPIEWIVGKSGVRHGAAMLSGKTTKNPIFVSCGHRVSLETAVEVVRACSIHRVPEPIRLADKLSREQAQSHIVKQNQYTA